MRRAASEDGIAVVEAPCGSDPHIQALRLREVILRQPLGLTLTEEEIADDAGRKHFCAMADGTVIGSVSLKPLGPHTLQLRQMAVARDRQGEGIGGRLLAYAEDWARRSGYGVIILNARIGADGFYSKFGYRCEGEVFDENTIPHIRMTKRLGWPVVASGDS
jgi:predicted GNAT family N-acyltransferase